MNGLELSRLFFQEWVRPHLEKSYRELPGNYAAGVLGMGSDVAGLDDDLSRDHHWGPRCNLLLSDHLEARCKDIESFLHDNCPQNFRGFDIYHNKFNRAGITVETVSGFFTNMVGIADAPAVEREWFDLTEADLFHITSGAVFYDSNGELERRRSAFAYFPENIRRKKLADWLVYLTAHGGYNINRARLRSDWATATIYLGLTVRRILEIGHTINGVYAPYNKWLKRSFANLPLLAGQVNPLLDRLLAVDSWEAKILDIIRIAMAINDELHRQGLSGIYYSPNGRVEITDSWLHFLYDVAIELYKSIPEPLVRGHFCDVEKWEDVVKSVLLDPDWKAGFTDLGEE